MTGLLLVVATAAYADREFRVYRSFEEQADQVELPKDWQKPAGFVVARMMYPSNFGGFGRRGSGDWHEGGTPWAVDYPRGDRYFAQILRRLTTIDVRSVEQPVNLDDGNDVFDWPYLIVGLPGFWDLTDEQVVKLREYLLRGGFLLADSFFGSREWDGFVEGMERVFPRDKYPNQTIKDLPDSHPLFHTVYDLDARHMVPNMNSLEGSGLPYRNDGSEPHWRAILDDNNRVMVAIAFNNDLGDSYQWADDPDYPAAGAELGLKMGVNFVVYALTH
ncbi:MAG TPA: DUF4159 domain-containing protein [Steroidobacteraceae bacterium]|nr:DUF4159 domain-containing protein [Steroidobacteraceae bacterium]